MVSSVNLVANRICTLWKFKIARNMINLQMIYHDLPIQHGYFSWPFSINGEFLFGEGP